MKTITPAAISRMTMKMIANSGEPVLTVELLVVELPLLVEDAAVVAWSLEAAVVSEGLTVGADVDGDVVGATDGVSDVGG